MKIYFIRHGETVWNTLRIFQGTSNSPLTKKGENQALNLGKRLKDVDFTTFYSSPLGRTIQTSNCIFEGMGKSMDINTIDEFKEISLGEMEGTPREEFTAKYPKEFDDFFNNPKEYDPTPYKGESFHELYDRVKLGLKKIVKNSKDDDVVAVISHGMTLKAILMAVNDMSFEEIGELGVPKNTSLTVVDYSDGKYTTELFSDISHITGEE